MNLESLSLILFNTKTLKHNFLTNKLRENLIQAPNMAVSWIQNLQEYNKGSKKY